MPQLLKPSDTQIIKTKEIHTKTKQGECKVAISLELNINLNSSGITIEGAKAAIEDDKVDWTIGDFSPKKKVKFGKSVQE